MKGLQRAAALLALPILLLAATGPAAAQDRTYKVGVLAGLSGLGAQIGQWMLDGVETAATAIDGEADGRRYEIIAEDSQWNPQKGIEGFNKLVNIDRVDVLISGGSSVMEAIAPLADQHGLVVVNAGAQSPKMAGLGRYVFSVLQLADFDIRVLTRYAHDELGYRKVALMYINNDTGKFNQAQFATDFEALGGEIAAAEAFRPNETNYGAQLAKIRASRPDALYVVGTPAEMPFAVKQARQMLPDVPILSYAGLESQEFLDAAGAAAEGIIYTTTAFDPGSDDPGVRAFVDAYAATKGGEPASPYIGYGYDALRIFDQALDETGGEAGEALRAAILERREFPGVTGDNVFQDDGTVAKAVAVKTVENGRFRVVTVVEP